MNKKSLTQKAAMVVVACAFAALGAYVSNLHAQKTQAADALFNSSLPLVATTDGTAQSLAKYRDKIIVVNFWATWCAPCVKEMPELSALQTELGQKKVSFIGVGIDTPEALAEFAQKYKITYPLYVAGMSGTQLSTTLGNKVGGLPFTVLINKSGEIVKTYQGKINIAALKSDILAVK